MTLPATQSAVQLIGPNELTLNTEKPVVKPGPRQVLAKVEVTGLCFSDLKLLKQFSGHVRKSEVLSGIDPEALNEIPSYVSGDKATVPGHETAVRIMEVGSEVKNIKPGDRFLVQADYRWLKTDQSNAAFGYNFEGALQQYVVLDDRVFLDPEGDSALLSAKESLPASAVALVEPWACVEDSYVVEERQTLKEGGRCLIACNGNSDASLEAFLAAQPKPAEVVRLEGDPAELADESFDDLLVFGCRADELEVLFKKTAKNALVLLMQCGENFDRDVVSPVGRFHYGGVRVAGTTGSNPAEAAAVIPATGEIREGDRIDVVGAGGPMGVMHVIRNLCQGVADVSVYGGDMSDERLDALRRVAQPQADRNRVTFETYNAKTNPPEGLFDYIALMVPAPPLVAAAIARAEDQGIINIFAGIPATVDHPLDLNMYIARRLYFIGTSGSTIDDMRIVLNKVTEGRLDTNLSVAAISGLDGAVDGIRAVENQSMPGKIIVYPSCKGLGLTPLTELHARHPEVAEKLNDGCWTQAAEETLLSLY
jgi:threonine dehydrogenase-like Zn-dependent dehydrogenase